MIIVENLLKFFSTLYYTPKVNLFSKDLAKIRFIKVNLFL